LGVSFEEIEEKITNLPALLDADAAPHGEEASWLAWLADWLDFQLSDAWEEDESRQNLGEAFEWYGRRGTIPGLRQYLKWYAGVNAIIEDPNAADRLWVLGEDSPLGFRTALSPGSISGAVLGSGTNLDKTHLAREDDCSAFHPYAHRFTVSIYCADLTRPGALNDAREILDREKPAHTEYTLCTIEPRMRVGHQARVGIDSIVAGGERLAQLDRVLDGTVMADAPEPCGDDRRVENSDCRVCDDEEEVS
jgi:phage tail-like protein